MKYKYGDFVIFSSIPLNSFFVDIILKNNKVYDFTVHKIVEIVKNPDLLMYTDIFRESCRNLPRNNQETS